MSFINARKVNNGKTFAPFKIGIGIFGAVYFSFQIFKSEMTSTKIMTGIVTLIFVWIAVSGIRKTRLYKSMYLIDFLLAKSESDRVPVSKLAAAAGMSEAKTQKLVQKLIKKQWLQNCELNTDSEPKIFLKAEEQYISDDISLICPDCGTKFTAKRGAVARCPECASIINM